jgi:hypothetical protein
MKWRKYNRRNRKHPRAGRNLHHLTPRSRGGKNTDDNLLLIDVEKHEYWHKIFGLKTLEETIALLIRLSKMKGRHKNLREIRRAA